jgi:hypothetical protein
MIFHKKHVGGDEECPRLISRLSSSPACDLRRKKIMCGIVGYIGQLDAKEILLKGLEKLEYRGYDSAWNRCSERRRRTRV